MFTIGKLSKESGLSRDCLRYYEREGLLSPCEKTEAGYRLYNTNSIHQLSFIQHAKRCGFTLSEINQLLSLRESDSTSCHEINQFAQDKKIDLDLKIKDLQSMSKILNDLLNSCQNDNSSVVNCQILNSLKNS